MQPVYTLSGSPHCISNMYPPSSGRHAMRSLYGIGRDGWVWDMSITQWLEMDSSHEVGECSVTVVWHRAGVHSDRPCHEIIVVVVGNAILAHVLDFVVVVGEGPVLRTNDFT